MAIKVRINGVHYSSKFAAPDFTSRTNYLAKTRVKHQIRIERFIVDKNSNIIVLKLLQNANTINVE